MNPVSRRTFLKFGAAGAAALGLGARLLQAAETAGKKIPIGLQLYSVRNECAKDLPKVLAAVAGFGYKGVEFAGYYSRKADELKKMLDDNGLVCCGTHTPYPTIQAANLKATVEFNKTLGNKYLIVPSMSHKTKDAWLEAAKLFNDVADQVKADGMFVGYHAHGHDVKPMDGSTPWDIFFGATKPEVVMQLDTGNVMGGGGDPVAILKKYPGRGKTIHLKEQGGAKDAVIGGGEVKWKEVFDLCEAGGTEWYIVEHERGGPDPVADVGRCLEALKKMGKC